MTDQRHSTIIDLAAAMRGRKFHTLLADPPWRFVNRTGKMAPEHRRLSRYQTMTAEDICALPVSDLMTQPAHLYLWVPNALLPEGLRVRRPGASTTKAISCGTRSARTAVRTDAVWGFTSAM